MAVATINSGAGNGNILSTIANTGSSGTTDPTAWSNLRSGTGSTKTATGDTASNRRQLYVDGGIILDNTSTLSRGYMPFSMASVPAGSTVSSVVLRIYFVSSGLATGYNGTVYIVESSQASISSLATSDWSAGSTSFCDAHPTMSVAGVNAYYEFTLNAAGIAFVEARVAATAKFAVLHSYDFSNTPPTKQVSSYLYDDLFAHMTGGTNKPELVVTYTPPPAGPGAPRRRPRGLYTR